MEKSIFLSPRITAENLNGGSFKSISYRSEEEVSSNNSTRISQLRLTSDVTKKKNCESMFAILEKKTKNPTVSMKDIYNQNVLTDIHEIWEQEENQNTIRNSVISPNKKIECNNNQNNTKESSKNFCLDICTFVINKLQCN